MIRFLDWQADRISSWLTPGRTRRIAVAMVDTAVLFLFYLPFSREPLAIFVMSQLALLFAGALAVVEGERWREDRGGNL